MSWILLYILVVGMIFISCSEDSTEPGSEIPTYEGEGEIGKITILLMASLMVK